MGSIGLETPPTAVLETPQVQEYVVVEAPARDQAATIVWAIAAFGCLIHFIFNGRYGYFRDELYYAACGQHLAWGYIDHAPLAPFIARLSRAALGDSLFALRFFPALAAAAKILLTAWMVRELGGRRFAQILAAVCIFIAPIYLTFDNFLSMNSFEPVFWMLCAAIFISIVRRGNQRLWLLFGLVAGVGILNKHSMLFFGLGLVLGILLTPERSVFRGKWIWLGALIAFAFFLPNLLWEIRNSWPTLDLLRRVAEIKNAPVTPLQFLLQQTLLMHPLETPIWLIGLYCLFFTPGTRRFRALGWTYVFVTALLILLKGKIYYLAPIYPLLIAAGAVQIDTWIRLHDRKWLKPAILAPLIVGGIVAAPLAMPILPVPLAASYSNFWDVDGVEVEKMPHGDLPQLFADMFGWENQAAVVAQVYQSLPDSDRAGAGILAWNYGQAGAIDYFGPKHGLPRAISGHNNYYLWGDHGVSGDVMIAFGFPADKLDLLKNQWDSVEPAAIIESANAMPEETQLTVYICRRPKRPFREAWASFRWLG